MRGYWGKPPWRGGRHLLLQPLDLVRALPLGVPQSGGALGVVACLAKLSAQRGAPLALLVELLGQRGENRQSRHAGRKLGRVGE
jgi:hypothetical protein